MNSPLRVFSGRIYDSADKDGQIAVLVVNVEDEGAIHDEGLPLPRAAAHLITYLFGALFSFE